MAAYPNALSRLIQQGTRNLGIPPGPTAIGRPPAVPAAQPHVEPPPYDAAQDPAWRGILDPADHEFRNFLNRITPEERQMLLLRAQARREMSPIPAPQPRIPPGMGPAGPGGPVLPPGM